MAQVGDTYGGLNSLLTAIAGALVFWAGFMQHRALRDAQLREAVERHARQQQATESAQALALAKQANDIAVETRRDGLRPWVQISTIPLMCECVDDVVQVTVKVLLKNMGGGPALKVTPSIQFIKTKTFGAPTVVDEGVSREMTALNPYPKLLKEFSDAVDTPVNFPISRRIMPGEEISVQMLFDFPYSDVISGDMPFAVIHIACGANYSPLFDLAARYKIGDMYVLTMANNRLISIVDLKHRKFTSAQLAMSTVVEGEGIFT